MEHHGTGNVEQRGTEAANQLTPTSSMSAHFPSAGEKPSLCIPIQKTNVESQVLVYSSRTARGVDRPSFDDSFAFVSPLILAIYVGEHISSMNDASIT